MVTPTTVSSPFVEAMVSIDGVEWCFAKFQNASYTELIRDDEVICANVDPEVKDGIPGREINMFRLVVDPTLPFLRGVLAATGMTQSPTDTFTSSMANPTIAIQVAMGGSTHKWEYCWINELTIKGQVSNIPISLEMTCIGQEETEVTSPTWTNGAADWIFGFPSSIHTVAGTAYAIDRFAIKISRNLIPEWNNSVYVTGVGLGVRQTMFATTIPYIAANKPRYWTDKRNNTRRAVTLQLTNGVRNILFTMLQAEFSAKGPSVDNTQQTIRLPLQWMANRNDTTPSAAFSFVLSNV